MAGMANDGIETSPGFYDLSLLLPTVAPRQPIASHVSASTIALPTYVGLNCNNLDRICESLRTRLNEIE